MLIGPAIWQISHILNFWPPKPPPPPNSPCVTRGKFLFCPLPFLSESACVRQIWSRSDYRRRRVYAWKDTHTHTLLYRYRFSRYMYAGTLPLTPPRVRHVTLRKLLWRKLRIREKLPNGWTDCHQIWHKCVDSSGNGYTLGNLPLETQGGTWGVFGCQTFKSLGKLLNGWTDWHQLWFTSADLSGNGHRLNTSRLSIPQGAFRRF